MQQRHHLLTLSKGVQADTTNHFVVWWVLFEYSFFGQFPSSTCTCMQTVWDIFNAPVLLVYMYDPAMLLFILAGPNKSRCGQASESAPGRQPSEIPVD